MQEESSGSRRSRSRSRRRAEFDTRNPITTTPAGSIDVGKNSDTLGKKGGKRCISLLLPLIRKANITRQQDIKQEHSIVALKVKMHCPGCAREVEGCLWRLKGVSKVDVDMHTQRVNVEGINIEPKNVCDRLMRKTGKKCEVLACQVMEAKPINTSLEGVGAKTPEEILREEEEKKKVQEAANKLANQEQQRKASEEIMSEITKFQYYATYLRSKVPTLEYDEETVIDDEDAVKIEAQDIFSDENPNACCVM